MTKEKNVSGGQTYSRTRGLLVSVRFMLFIIFLLLCGIMAIDLFDLGGDFALPPCENAIPDTLDFDKCDWVLLEENGEYFLSLNADGVEVAHIEISRLDVSDASEFIDSPHLLGWGTFIRVAPSLRNQGLGELMWRLGDQLIKARHGAGEIRIFINASIDNSNFAQKIEQNVNPVFTTPDGDFIYIIR